MPSSSRMLAGAFRAGPRDDHGDAAEQAPDLVGHGGGFEEILGAASDHRGDEDETCLDGSVFLKRTAPTAGLLVIPRSGHTITSEEPAAVNAALAELFATAENGRWMAHRPAA